MKKKFYYLGPDLQYFTARQCYVCLVSAVKEDIHENISFVSTCSLQLPNGLLGVGNDHITFQEFNLRNPYCFVSCDLLFF